MSLLFCLIKYLLDSRLLKPEDSSVELQRASVLMIISSRAWGARWSCSRTGVGVNAGGSGPKPIEDWSCSQSLEWWFERLECAQAKVRGSFPGHEISGRPVSGWTTDALGGDGSGGEDGVILKREPLDFSNGRRRRRNSRLSLLWASLVPRMELIRPEILLQQWTRHPNTCIFIKYSFWMVKIS